MEIAAGQKETLVASLLHERLSQEANFIKFQRPCLEAEKPQEAGLHCSSAHRMASLEVPVIHHMQILTTDEIGL